MLYDTIMTDIKEAMKSHDKETLSTLRFLKSAIDLFKINNKMDRTESPNDDTVIEVVSKQVKTHKESIEEFKKAGRNDLVENLLKEVQVLSKYLPEQLSEDEVRSKIDEVISSVKASSIKDMGKVMKELTPIFKGKADMKLVNTIVKEKLN
ncbi:MAG: GatB/YqeY domain-containing protein [Clostridium sp.]|nr:GatB/YqeY domain-containing protein [Clostridium sp.]